MGILIFFVFPVCLLLNTIFLLKCYTWGYRSSVHVHEAQSLLSECIHIPLSNQTLAKLHCRMLHELSTVAPADATVDNHMLHNDVYALNFLCSHTVCSISHHMLKVCEHFTRTTSNHKLPSRKLNGSIRTMCQP